MYLLNCIAGGEAIEKVLECPGAKIDDLPLAYEFGTYGCANYMIFFEIIGKIDGENLRSTYTFKKEEKELIHKALKKITSRIISNGEIHSKTLSKKLRSKCNIFGDFDREGLKMALASSRFNNPLLLNSLKWYEKLLKIFSEETVSLIRA